MDFKNETLNIKSSNESLFENLLLNNNFLVQKPWVDQADDWNTYRFYKGIEVKTGEKVLIKINSDLASNQHEY